MNFAQNITHAIFFFPDTFLHELLHLFAVLIVSILIAIFAIGYMLYSATGIQEIFAAVWHAFTSPLSLAASLFSSGDN